MTLTYHEYRSFLKSYHPKTVRLLTSCQELAVQAEKLQLAFADSKHDLWDEKEFHVSPAKLQFAKSLRKKEPDEWSETEIDRVMSSCMWTMGGDETYKWIIPKFLKNCSTYPKYFGWMSECHVQFNKLNAIDLRTLNSLQFALLAESLDAFAYQEIAMRQEFELLLMPKAGNRRFILRYKGHNSPYRLLALTHKFRQLRNIN